MEIEILTENFKKGLLLVEKITRKISNLPVLKNVLMEVKDNYLELSTTNLEISAQCQTLCRAKKTGKVLVPATFLLETLNYLKSDRLNVSLKESNLLISTKNHQIQIQGQNTEEFPIIPKINKADYFTIPLKILLEGLSQVVNIPSFSQVRPEISGIYFNLTKDHLILVATDSFRLAEKTIELPEKAKKEFTFILPQSTVQEILNIFSGKEGVLNVFYTPNQVLFNFEEEGAPQLKIEILSRLIEGEYPRYQEIFPKKIKTEGIFNKETFQDIIKEAGLFSGKISEVKFSLRVKEKKLVVSSQSYDLGKQQSQTEARLQGEEIDVSYNFKFLIDGLQNIKSSEVMFLLSDKDGPGVLKGVGDQTYRYILMPIKSS